jgi:G3E family GTPase
MEKLIHQVNPAAALHATIKAQIDLGRILNVDAYRVRPLDHTQEDSANHAGHDHGEGEDCYHMNHYEVRGITSLSLTCPPLVPEKLAELDIWIRALLWEHKFPGGSEEAPPVEVLRCKGAFSVGRQQHILQGVRDIYEIVAIGEEEPRAGKLVLIGRNLDKVAAQSSISKIFS